MGFPTVRVACDSDAGRAAVNRVVDLAEGGDGAIDDTRGRRWFAGAVTRCTRSHVYVSGSHRWQTIETMLRECHWAAVRQGHRPLWGEPSVTSSYYVGFVWTPERWGGGSNPQRPMIYVGPWATPSEARRALLGDDVHAGSFAPCIAGYTAQMLESSDDIGASVVVVTLPDDALEGDTLAEWLERAMTLAGEQGAYYGV